MTKSKMIKKSLQSDNFNQPQSISTITSYVVKSAEKKREILREKIRKLVEAGARFAVALDEWTCPGKRARFLNICLHYMTESINLGMDHVNGSLPAKAMREMLIKKLLRFGLSKLTVFLCIDICQSTDW